MKARKKDVTSCSANKALPIWEKIWKAKSAPKILTFGWKALHDSIPVQANLIKRQLCAEGRCQMCGEEEETVMHALVKCPDAAMIWRTSPLRVDTSVVVERKLMEWCLVLQKDYKEDLWWSLFWNFFWGIWLKRNAWIFNQRKITIMEVINNAAKFVSE